MKILTRKESIPGKYDYYFSSLAEFYEVAKVLRKKLNGSRYSFYILRPKEDLMEIKKFVEHDWNFDITLVLDKNSAELLVKVFNTKIENENYVTILKKQLSKSHVVIDNKSFSIACKLVEEPKTEREVLELVAKLAALRCEITSKVLAKYFNIDFDITPMEVINAYLYNFRWRDAKASKAFRLFSNEMMFYLLRKELKKLEIAYDAYFKGDIENKILSNKNHDHLLKLFAAFYYVESRGLKDARLIFTIMDNGGVTDEMLYRQRRPR